MKSAAGGVEPRLLTERRQADRPAGQSDLASRQACLLVREALSRLREQMFTGDKAASRRPIGLYEPLERHDFGVVVEGEEQRKRKALGRGLSHAMRGRYVSAVGEDFHHVADIDDE